MNSLKNHSIPNQFIPNQYPTENQSLTEYTGIVHLFCHLLCKKSNDQQLSFRVWLILLIFHADAYSNMRNISAILNLFLHISANILDSQQI